MPYINAAHTFDAHTYDAHTLQGEEAAPPPTPPSDDGFGDDVESGATPHVGDVSLKSSGGFA